MTISRKQSRDFGTSKILRSVDTEWLWCRLWEHSLACSCHRFSWDSIISHQSVSPSSVTTVSNLNLFNHILAYFERSCLVNTTPREGESVQDGGRSILSLFANYFANRSGYDIFLLFLPCRFIDYGSQLSDFIQCGCYILYIAFHGFGPIFHVSQLHQSQIKTAIHVEPLASLLRECRCLYL